MSQWLPPVAKSSIAVRAKDCSDAFAAYLTNPAQISDREEWAEEQRARFNMWAANLGVFADGHASIDHRLRDSSKTHRLIFQLLDALYANLDYCIRGTYEIRLPEKKMDSLPKPVLASEEIIEPMKSPEALDSSTARGDILEHHSKPPSRSSSFASVSTDRDSKFSPELLSEACLDIEGVIDRLNRLSTAIRKSGEHQSDGRAEEFEPKDEDDEDMIPEFKRFAAAVIRRDTPQATELLRERMLESVTRRWRRLLYRRSHQAKLSRGTKQLEMVLPTVAQQLPSGKDIGERSETRSRVSKSTPKLNQSPAPAMSSTKASTLKSKDFSTVAPSVDNSSRVTRSSIQGNKLDIPKPPKSSFKNNVFECPYCRILCPVKEASGSRWNEHFIRDLAPYICMFEECDKRQHNFRTSDAWITHMVREHMPIEWICLMHKSGSNLSTTEEQVFRSEDDYMQHMYQGHSDSLAKKQLLTLAQISQRPTTDVFKICQFCGGIPDDLEVLKQDPDKLQHALQKHVGTHLQSLAMISLPWDSSQLGSVASSNEVQGDYDDKPDRKNKNRPSEESDNGSDSESDHFHNLEFIDPPLRISKDADHDLIDYRKLESKSPGEPYEPDLINLSHATSDDPVWDTSRRVFGRGEWEFMEDERPPDWKGQLPYQGHSSNSKLASFINAWRDRLAAENKAANCEGIRRCIENDAGKMSCDPGDEWFPLTYSKELLEKEDIEAVLKEAKKQHPEWKWKSTISDLTAFVRHNAPKLFTMLVYHQSEKMLDQFCGQGMDDSMFPVNLGQSKDSIASTNKNKPKKLEFEFRFANDVCGWQWEFFVPELRWTAFDHPPLARKSKLPFLTIKEISRTDFSVVYKGVVHRAHITLDYDGIEITTDEKDHPYVAVKELLPTGLKKEDSESFIQAEYQTLNRLRRYKTPHLIKAIAFYRKKTGMSEALHFVFPWAEHGNLRQFWQQKTPRIHDYGYMKWIFDQLVGLANAICTLHHEDDKSCRHGDLKPENVLCFNSSRSTIEKDQTSCILVISDVGLSRIHDKSTEIRSRTRNIAAETVTYAAPETALFPERPTSRRYDIWSLGCIYLEFVIWILYGIEGLNRFGEEISKSTERRFYIITSLATLSVAGGKTPQVSPVVTNWIEHIKQDSRCAGAGLNRTAIGRLIALIEKRLLVVIANPDPKDLKRGDEDEATADPGERTDIPMLKLRRTTTLSEEARSRMSSQTAKFANTGEYERAYALEVCDKLDKIVQDVEGGVIKWLNFHKDGLKAVSDN